MKSILAWNGPWVCHGQACVPQWWHQKIFLGGASRVQNAFPRGKKSKNSWFLAIFFLWGGGGQSLWLGGGQCPMLPTPWCCHWCPLGVNEVDIKKEPLLFRQLCTGVFLFNLLFLFLFLSNSNLCEFSFFLYYLSNLLIDSSFISGIVNFRFKFYILLQIHFSSTLYSMEIFSFIFCFNLFFFHVIQHWILFRNILLFVH